MTGFAADWLTLREPYDARARSVELERALAAWAASRAGLDIADLGSGTGAGFRHLSPALPEPQRWRLIEHDPALIAAGEGRLPAGGGWRYVRADLARDLEATLASALDLVTASALIDLVAAPWLGRLVNLVIRRRAALLVVLTYDGRIGLDPPHPDDSWIVRRFNEHQRTDKGFGQALGPDAAAHLAGRLRAAPGRLLTAPSDWRYGAEATAFHAALVEGWAAAALAMEPDAAARIDAWRRDRLRAPPTAASIGHQDLLWLPDA
jgi:hypothetical protein